MEVTREVVFPAPPEEVWEALTEPERLEEWFANEVEPGERLVLDWDDEGEVVFTLEEVPDGARLLVREVSAEWSTALELRASALAWTAA